jgi:hypothetical protein
LFSLTSEVRDRWFESSVPDHFVNLNQRLRESTIMSNEKKNATLGMSHGTACGRLRKNILFSLLVQLKENICFKCSKPIENVGDLSIEHKKPWEGISADLFWDLENIAFSHLRCNVPHTYGGGGWNRKNAPEGKSWCAGCQDFLDLTNFWSDSSKWNGLSIYCKLCKEERKTDR